MDETPIDLRHAAMMADAADAGARLAFYERLADGELFLLLDAEPEGDTVEPRLLVSEGARYVLAFDREARLSAFAGAVTPQATLSGRALAAMLAGQGLGIALNPEVAPSAMLIPAEAVDWLAATLSGIPEVASGRAVEVFAPGGVPEALLRGLDAKLAAMRGMAEAAWLVGVRYEDGRRGHLLAFVGAVPQAEEALAVAVREALVFSGVEAGALDVTFVAPDAAVVGRMARVGMRFDLPITGRSASTAPGMDPEMPPKLR